MKFLVDEASGLIRGSYEFPLDFSVSGKYVIDVPTALGVTASTDVVSDLVTSKLNAYKAAHPSLTNSLNDEFLTAAQVDTGALSTGYQTGVNKRVALLPSGVIQTTVLVAPTTFTKVFLHFHLFTLSQEAPGLSVNSPGAWRMLYSYDPSLSAFSEPAQSLVTVNLMDSTGVTNLLTMTPESEQSFSQTGPFSFRLRFTNVSTTKTLYLSDWVFLYT